MGPIHGQAESITRMLRSHTTAVHVVTLLEEMPVQETIDALADLRDASLPVGAVVVNQVRAPLLSGSALRAVGGRTSAAFKSSVRADLAAAGLKATDALVTGLLAEGREHADRVALEREQDAVLVELGRRMVRLPLLAEGTDAGGIAVLADEVAEQGMV
jgi:anion-transporting  ArsA/GET3 family ATPase